MIDPLTSARDKRILLAAALVYAALSAWMAVASPYFLEADGISHFLARRFALDQPLHLVGVWSRPLCVALYSLPAKFGGLTATRLTSLALVLAAIPLVMASARHLGLRRPAWAGLFLLTQPLLFAHSFSELTEVPFALLMIAAFYAYQRKWFGLMAGLVAVAPLGRPEGFGLLLVAAVALVLHRRFVWMLVLPLGLLLWSWGGWHVFGGPKDYAWWQWLGRNWPYSPDSVYGRGRVLTFVQVLPAVIGPIGFGFAVFGVIAMLRRGNSGPLSRYAGGGLERGAARTASDIQSQTPSLTLPREYTGEGTRGRPVFEAVRRLLSNHRARCRTLVVAIPVGILVVHSLLWVTGKMASNGEPRYLLVAAPFWAILAAAGLEKSTRQFHWRRPLVPVAIGALLPIAANLIYPVFPLGPQNDDRLAERVSTWLAENGELRERFPRMYAWSPHLFFKLDLDKLNDEVAGQPTRADAAAAPRGTLLMWDSVYSVFNSSSDYVVTRQMLAANGWRAIETFVVDADAPWAHTVVVYVSPEDAAGRATGVVP